MQRDAEYLLQQDQQLFDCEETAEVVEMNELNSRADLDLVKRKDTAHAPIPATVVFACEAAPLYLPDLDSFLAGLPAPVFSDFTSGVRLGKKIIGQGMFPPMDQLTATNRTITDLETNTTMAPAWRNPKSILNAISNSVLSITGSSPAAKVYSLHSLIDVLQIFALLLNSMVPLSDVDRVKEDWNSLFTGTIPNVLALNFGTTVTRSSTILAIFILISMILLRIFWAQTKQIEDQSVEEGFPALQRRENGWHLIAVSFVLTVLYLPLSTIAIHALVWSTDFWVIPNPYVNATSNPPDLPSLGPSNEYYDVLDFCYTTTMKRNEVNFAPIIVLVSVASFLSVTIWFPLQLRCVIRRATPKVDRFTERGTPRSSSELDREYQRLLERDRSPVSFLYSDYRRGWGAYQATYLFAKLSALLIVSVISSDNCLLRTLNRSGVSITRQAVLSVTMFGFFLFQCFRAPFINPVSNASEWTSRLSYLLTSLVGLVAALDAPGSVILSEPVLYIIYILTYGFAVYFVCINFSWMQRLVKCVTLRVDFSIDIFSPRLDLSRSSAHVKRRTWQESITALLLTSPECRIHTKQHILYAEARDTGYPPYLLGFSGSPAERHIENLKILREIGMEEYVAGCQPARNEGKFAALQQRILREFTGPDVAWLDNRQRGAILSRFGTAWWIPFPPTLVLQYDEGGRIVLNSTDQFEEYVRLNSSELIRKKRQLRLVLRSLDGLIVRWPYEYQEPVGNRHRLLFGRQYQARRLTKLRRCVFSIGQKGRLVWKDIDLGSGFNPTLVYTKKIKVAGDILGINDEWELTPTLARFLTMNQTLVLGQLPRIEWTIDDFRDHHFRECCRKVEVLSYQFLTEVFDRPQRHAELVKYVTEQENDLRVRELVLGAASALEVGLERFERAVSSKVTAWWYIFWDDLWRRNYDTYKNLRLHEQDFNPYYPTSIAYKPLPRPALEAFLRQRGLYGGRAFLHSGLLNKMYFWLSEIVFRNSNRAVLLHVGESTTEINVSAIDALVHARSSSLGTGGGTDHDDVSIRARPIYRWEGLLEDPIRDRQTESGWLGKLGVWLGLTPLWRSGVVSRGVALDVKLENGRYVKINDNS